MAILINKWLVPTKPEIKKSLFQRVVQKLPLHMVTREYWSNNLRLWILLISLVNLVIMAQRIYYYSDLTMVNGFSPRGAVGGCL